MPDDIPFLVHFVKSCLVLITDHRSCFHHCLALWKLALQPIYVKASMADYFLKFVLLIVATAISAAPTRSMVIDSIKHSETCDLAHVKMAGDPDSPILMSNKDTREKARSFIMSA